MTISEYPETFLFRVKPIFTGAVKEYKLPQIISIADFIQYVKEVTVEEFALSPANNHIVMERLSITEAGQESQEAAPSMEPSHYISMYEQYGDRLSLMTFYVRLRIG